MVGFTKSTKDPPLKVKMLSAGLAGIISDLITFPLDTAKVRLQVQGEGVNTVASGGGGSGVLSLGNHGNNKYRGMLHTLATISREEGPRCLYNGLTPGLQRQMAFCAVRIGCYDAIRDFYLGLFNKSAENAAHVPLRILAGATTGSLAVLVAQPTDVVKIRMQADTSGGANRRYTGSISAYRQIGKDEGLRGLWKGTSANVARMTVVNAAELVSYDLIKTTLLRHDVMADALPCHFVSAFGAGFCTTVVASPVDVVKTRFMNSAPGVYNGVLNCAITVFRENGPLAFYKGFMPNFMRLASWNICMFVAFEQLKRAFMQLPEFHKTEQEQETRSANKLLPVSAKIIARDSHSEGNPT